MDKEAGSGSDATETFDAEALVDEGRKDIDLFLMPPPASQALATPSNATPLGSPKRRAGALSQMAFNSSPVHRQQRQSQRRWEATLELEEETDISLFL